MTRNAAPDGSIVRRDSPRPDLLAFDVRGKISKPDIEWMASIAEAAMNAQDEIDMLIVMSNYEGPDVGAIFDRDKRSASVRSPHP
jgi:hypothetical protein